MVWVYEGQGSAGGDGGREVEAAVVMGKEAEEEEPEEEPTDEQERWAEGGRQRQSRVGARGPSVMREAEEEGGMERKFEGRVVKGTGEAAGRGLVSPVVHNSVTPRNPI